MAFKRNWISVDPRVLAHCRHCVEPMYCIYDAALRDLCYECEQQIRIENAQAILRPKQYR